MLTIGVWNENGPATVITRLHMLRHGTHLVWYSPIIRLVPIVLPQHSRFNSEIAYIISGQELLFHLLNVFYNLNTFSNFCFR